TSSSAGGRSRSTFRPRAAPRRQPPARSEEHTSELQSHLNLVCRLLLEKTRGQQNEHNTAALRFARLHRSDTPRGTHVLCVHLPVFQLDRYSVLLDCFFFFFCSNAAPTSPPFPPSPPLLQP